MSAGSRGTSIRPLGKILEAIGEPVYVVTRDGRFEYFNRAALEWLGCESQPLLDWKPSPDRDPASAIDALALSLQPPKILRRGRPISQPIAPRVETLQGPASREMLFIPLGETAVEFVVAVGDCHWSGEASAESIDLVSLSRQLAAIRQQYPRLNQLGPLVGASGAAEHLRRQASLAAECSSNVFLVGRSGCGGDQLALAIHRRPTESPSAWSSLTPIDCALMDAELLEAALSPVIARLGGSSTARATVLLRNLDRLAVEAQSPLRQRLAEFGSRLRCISLSELSVAECLRSEHLDGDLIYRLATLEIAVPSLTQRIIDLPLIVQFLIERRAKPNQIIDGISRPALDLLSTYPWPGDFDELNAAIRHSMRESGSPVIQPQHLPLAIRSYTPPDPAATADDRPIDLDRLLARIERELIDRALERSDGNRAEAARRLGISRSRLLRRIDDNDDSTEAEG
ncbi:helix-turn-helix domain-containing protein [Rosistilla oblonga]|uniref:helix-turn-helix domain-containing protein n=1 Tax=Rosistilla oblonga TaxID=2527990 RepID=UPI003A9872B1